jgi:serine/threonine protein phosphatase 1
MSGMTTGRVIAIGDIHGCSAALETLVSAIRPAPEDTLVTLGDYIDRGPDSRGVIERLMQLAGECILVPILGNHEEMLFGAGEALGAMQFWLRFGGDTTLASYGITRPQDIPARHLMFMKGCRDSYETVTHIFTHGYYEPALPMAAQSPSVLRWTSLPMNPQPHSSGKVVVVGHTPQHNGEILDLGFLKGIDTFCHGDGWLTALDVTTGQVWQANREGLLRRREE